MLVTVARYRTITGDTTTKDPPIEAALTTAQGLLEDELGRALEEGERTERLRIYYGHSFPGGRVYPAVTPITAAASGLTLVGTAALDGATPSGGPFDTARPAYASVTYTGGYTEANVPAYVERDIAWAAYELVRPENTAQVPVGANSRRMGDAAITYGAAQNRATTAVRWSPQTLRHRRRRI